jgi:hypothetical protein
MYRVLSQPEGQLFMCAAFAAPLMAKSVGQAKNLILSIWDSHGGKGKSTLLEAVNTVWGHPLHQTCSKNDTLSARYQILGVRRNLPVCMDELTTMKPAEMSALLFTIANGREKRKSNSQGTNLVKTGHWETITMVTTNRSIYEIMQAMSGHTKAEMMRVVEMNCTFKNYAGTEQGQYISEVSKLMERHYGIAGPLFLDWCFQEHDLFEQIATNADEFAQSIMVNSDERFWGYGLGMILAAGRLACDWGLLNYDMEVLEIWVRSYLIPRMRGSVAGATATGTDVLANFLNANLDNTLAVRYKNRPKNMPSASASVGNDPYILFAPRARLHIRFELDSKDIYIDKRFLNTWLDNMRLSTETFLADLETAKIYDSVWGKTSRIELGRSTLYNYGKTMCYKFNGQALETDLPYEEKEDDND